ncbi:thiol:disulfide interchange protein [Halorhodospira abdelmalekii]|nr:thiol:disulfide interchange protein [Halorhodospira abdelmalekii]
MLQQSVALGPLALSIGQLLILVAIVVALVTGALAGLRQQVRVIDYLLALLTVGLISARAAFVVRYWGSFDGPLAMIDIRDGGFEPIGALIGGAFYVAWRLWRSPQVRRPLVTAIAAGGITWGLTAGPMTMIEQQSRPLPDVEISTLEGERLGLAELAAAKGQPLVVNLWATWCPHCIREMPTFAQLQQEESDVSFLFINQGEGPAQVRRFLEERNPGLENIYLDPRNAVGNATGSQALPTTLFYSAEGQLVHTQTGGASRATIERGLQRLRSD